MITYGRMKVIHSPMGVTRAVWEVRLTGVAIAVTVLLSTTVAPAEWQLTVTAPRSSTPHTAAPPAHGAQCSSRGVGIQLAGEQVTSTLNAGRWPSRSPALLPAAPHAVSTFVLGIPKLAVARGDSRVVTPA